jgi:hypothetical protein
MQGTRTVYAWTFTIAVAARLGFRADWVGLYYLPGRLQDVSLHSVSMNPEGLTST